MTSDDGRFVVWVTVRRITQIGQPLRPALFVLDTLTGTRTKISSPAFVEPLDPIISGDGQRVVFNAYPTNGEDEEVYVYRVDSGSLRRVTPRSDGRHSFATAVSRTGRRVAIVTGGLQIHDLGTGEVIDVDEDINTSGFIDTSMDLSPDGTRVVWSDQGDPVGENSDNNEEVFWFDTITATVRQVTHTETLPQAPDDANRAPRLLVGGHVIELVSDFDLDGSGLSDGWARYLFDIDTGTFEDLREVGPGSFDFTLDTLGYGSQDLTRVAYESGSNPTGDNPDRNREIFVADVATGETTQLTNSPPRGAEIQAFAADGSAVLFKADRTYPDPAPRNDQFELFLARPCGPSPRPDLAIGAVADGSDAVGDDVYSAEPIDGQEKALDIVAGGTRTFYVQVRNDRAITDRFTLHGVDNGAVGYTVAYRRDQTDITAAVQAGSYRTGTIQPGETVTIKIKVTASTAVGPARTVDLTATSRANPVARDTVRARVTRV